MDGLGARTVNLVTIYVSTTASNPMALPWRQRAPCPRWNDWTHPNIRIYHQKDERRLLVKLLRAIPC